MKSPDRYIEAPDLSQAWLRAVMTMYDSNQAKAVHLILRIDDPRATDDRIAAAAQELIDDWNLASPPNKQKYDILTTRNTMFPASWATRLPEPAELAEYYRGRYKRLREHDSNNRFGTYFGRLVAYPRETKHSNTADQLSEVVRKIREELNTPGPKSSRYELNIFSERYDTNVMSFPCLAHISFHLHERRLHQQAIYRNEYLIGRAYGNYLGLAELQCYIADACEIDVGEFLVTVGHVELDGRRTAIRSILERFRNQGSES